MSILIVGVVVVLALVYVAQPLLQGSRPETVGTPGLVAEAQERKRAALAAILELEEENQVGKLSDDDMAALRTQYEGAALQALRELEELGAVSRAETDDLEAEIARTKATLVCPHCGAIRPPSATCPSCGR